jgi:ATP-dependent DNA helicase PIF1
MSVLRKLEGDSLYFEAQDYGVEKGRMETHCIAPAKLEIKVNAQVMLLRNQSGSCGLANGSIGTVIRFTDKPADNVRARTGPEGEPLPSLNKSGELLPVVRFATDMGGATEMVVGREEWTLEMPGGRILAARIQIPLCLAWALSIHKSQGQTLQKVRVDLGKTFERGKGDCEYASSPSMPWF